MIGFTCHAHLATTIGRRREPVLCPVVILPGEIVCSSCGSSADRGDGATIARRIAENADVNLHRGADVERTVQRMNAQTERLRARKAAARLAR